MCDGPSPDHSSVADSQDPDDPGSPFSGFLIVRLEPGFELIPGETLLEAAREEPSLGSLSPVLERAGVDGPRLISHPPPEAIVALENRARDRYGGPSRSLALFWKIDVRSMSEVEIEELGANLDGDPTVGLVYRQYAASNPSPNGTTPDYSGNQGFHKAAPEGIDVEWMRGLPGGQGEGMMVVDVEDAWNTDHEDLKHLISPYSAAKIPNSGINGVAPDRQHGTEVVGVIAAEDNGHGVVGITPGLKAIKLASECFGSTPSDCDDISNKKLEEALVRTKVWLELNSTMKGDVVLLEVSRLFWPAEIDGFPVGTGSPPSAVQSAIKTMDGLGFVVVEAAGNFNRDLADNPFFAYDSGAIMVAASNKFATGTLYKRWEAAPYGSNRGSRIDCFAWGEGVWTCGPDEDISSPNNRPMGVTDLNKIYNVAFNGTSAAAAIVAGAAALLQACHTAATGSPLIPSTLRSYFSSNDPAFGNTLAAPGEEIGVMPNLRGIMEKLGVGSTGVPDVFVRDHPDDGGEEPSTGPTLQSPDIVVLDHELPDPDAALGAASGTLDALDLFGPVKAGTDHFVYVRIRNRGAISSSATQATVYWGEVSTLLVPENWHPIGTTDPFPVMAGSVTVVAPVIKWAKEDLPPPGHYCYVIELHDPQDPVPPHPVGMTFQQFMDYVKAHNNVGWRNFNVAGSPLESGDTLLSFDAIGDKDRPFSLEVVPKLPPGIGIHLELDEVFFQFLDGPAAEDPDQPFVFPLENLQSNTVGPFEPLRRPPCGRDCFPFRLRLRVPTEVRTDSSHRVVVTQTAGNGEIGRVTWVLQNPRKL